VYHFCEDILEKTTMKSPRLHVMVFCCCLVLATGARSQALRIGSWDQKSDPLTVSSEAVLSRAYLEAKQPVIFLDLPLRRAAIMLANKEIDGNLHRVAAFAEGQADLVRLNTPVNGTSVRMYTIRQDIRPQNWKQLAGLRVAVRRGVLIIEQNLVADVVRVEAKSEHDALRMVVAGIVDLALVAEPQQYPSQAMAVDSRLQRLDVVLSHAPLYHYLLKRHSALAERLDAILGQMQASGESDALRQRALQNFH